MAPPAGADWRTETDLVVVGGGAAGLSAALAGRTAGLRVLVLDKGAWTTGARRVVRYPEAATSLAQGGIAVVGLPDEPPGDSVDAHVADTLEAGAGLCLPAPARAILASGAAAVRGLIDLGCVFDPDPERPAGAGIDGFGPFARTREGGHGRRRILHAGGDCSGAAIETKLQDAAAGLPALQNATVTAVLRDDRGVTGVRVLDPRGVGEVRAPAVLLATGGGGTLFPVSTNPQAASADGVALALRAGAVAADLEFVQFHPSVLYDDGKLGQRPLVSEAVRGEGATLVDSRGRSVMAGVDPRGDLAPRDIVARAISMRMREIGEPCVYLDARGIEGFALRFPTVTAGCATAGVDPARELIPVAPAAHYQCGGVVATTDGETTLPGLLVAGEVARTGLHGANRLASNSLLEAVVCGTAAAGAAARRILERGSTRAQAGTAERGRQAASGGVAGAGAERCREAVPVQAPGRAVPRGDLRDPLPAVRAALGAGAAVARDAEGLAEAARALAGLPGADGRVLVARALVAAARERTETRGAHTRLDHPESDPMQARSLRVQLTEDGDIEIQEERL